MNRTLWMVVAGGLAAGACGAGGGGNPADARSGAIDGAAGAYDAVPVADAAICAVDLAPADDQTGIAVDLILSEIDPGNFIELYNNTSAAIRLGDVSHQLCSPFVYAALATLAPSVVIAPGGYATIPWPSTFTDTDAGGEVILFKNSGFSTSSNIVDFVCWGTNPHSSRLSQAVSVGKWVGDCNLNPIPTGGSIQRNTGTTGTAIDSYDLSATPTPTNCAP